MIQLITFVKKVGITPPTWEKILSYIWSKGLQKSPTYDRDAMRHQLNQSKWWQIRQKFFAKIMQNLFIIIFFFQKFSDFLHIYYRYHIEFLALKCIRKNVRKSRSRLVELWTLSNSVLDRIFLQSDHEVCPYIFFLPSGFLFFLIAACLLKKIASFFCWFSQIGDWKLHKEVIRSQSQTLMHFSLKKYCH